MRVLLVLLVLLSALWSGVAAMNVKIPEKVYEFARDDNITLPCTFTSSVTNPSLVIITWTALAQVEGALDDVVLSHYQPPGKTDATPDYKGRASINLDMKTGRADLKLNSITLKDNREFECAVQIPGDATGQTADKTRLVVLVAPSPPKCNIQGTAEYFKNINLTCVSEEGSPPPSYKWQGYDTNNQPRAPDPKTTDKGGILSLFNITKETSGYYICTSSNKIRSATCNITVKVMPPSMMSVGSTAGIIVGVVAFLILLGIIIYCCCCRKKQDNEEYAMGVQGEEYRDKEPIDGERQDKERSERGNDRRKDYDDRRSDYDDRRNDYDDRRSDYDDRRSDYDDRRNKYGDRRERYDDDRHYDDRRDPHDNER
ncbi:cell surface A33 antigen isoform X1 [Kryptolebias marmoratus]|uniref:cell surface A33 antigen isoform X1 n=1 Tax=Kryptolebias marmoratus TaxID=37003 RepID=UPI0007F8DB2D|nr:cell surface A33 antigen isoform X1 [Kryptolebias marmoratus]